jgi:asparagine synthase (glutamine-hydrolysing)
MRTDCVVDCHHSLGPSPNSGFWGKLSSDSPERLEANKPVVDFLDCQVLFHGYISNRNDLRELCPEQFGSIVSSDAQLLAVGYRHWGLDLQRRVHGEYCGLILDKTSKTALLTHDALALRPLFYAVRHGALHAASHLEELTSRLGLTELCEEYIADFLTLSRHYGKKTVFQDCNRLEPGYSLIWQNGSIRKARTWDLNEAEDCVLKSSQEYKERFCQLINNAIKGASGRKTWAELSGGLDSSSIVCLADGLGLSGFETISIVYSRSESADESDWMREVLNGRNIPWNTLDEDVHAPFSGDPDRFIPTPHQGMLSWSLLKEYESLINRNDVDVVLSGMGGDQILYGGAPRPNGLADDIRRLRLFSAIRSVRQWSSASRRSDRFILGEYGLLPLKNYFLGNRISETKTQESYCPWINKTFAQRFGIDNRVTRGIRPKARSVGCQDFLEDLYVLSSNSEQHWNQIVRGFEMRFPLLYLPLVEFMSALPLAYKCQPGENRVLQRRSLANVLPERILTRKDKKGPDQAFFDSLSRNPEFVKRLTNSPEIVQRGFVDSVAWNEAVRKATVGVVPRFSAFFASVALEIWLQQWRQEGPNWKRARSS